MTEQPLRDAGIGQLADPPVCCACRRDLTLEERLAAATEHAQRVGVAIGRAAFTQARGDYAAVRARAMLAAGAFMRLADRALQLEGAAHGCAIQEEKP